MQCNMYTFCTGYSAMELLNVYVQKHRYKLSFNATCTRLVSCYRAMEHLNVHVLKHKYLFADLKTTEVRPGLILHHMFPIYVHRLQQSVPFDSFWR